MGGRKPRRCASAVVGAPPQLARLALVAATTRARSSSRVPFQSQIRCATRGSLSREIAAEPLLLDAPVAVLLAVEQHDGYPVAVLALQLDVGLDVELGPGLADPVQHPGRHLAQMAAGPRDQGDPLIHAGPPCGSCRSRSAASTGRTRSRSGT